jgi:hypothetical protein
LTTPRQPSPFNVTHQREQLLAFVPVETARNTTCRYVLVRNLCVLGESRLGDAVGRQVIPRLRAIAATDPTARSAAWLPYSYNGGKPTAEHLARGMVKCARAASEWKYWSTPTRAARVARRRIEDWW